MKKYLELLRKPSFKPFLMPKAYSINKKCKIPAYIREGFFDYEDELRLYCSNLPKENK